MEKGRLLTLASIAALLVAAWRLEEIAPSLQTLKSVAVPLVLVLALHLHLGYRGFRWLVGAGLVLAGSVAAYRLVQAGPLSVPSYILLSLLCLAALLLGPALCFARAAGAHLERRRAQRSENVPALMLALWIVLLAVVAVWLWVGAGVQVF